MKKIHWIIGIGIVVILVGVAVVAKSTGLMGYRNLEATLPTDPTFNTVTATTGTFSNLIILVGSTSGTIAVADGSVSAPGLAFKSDLDNGLYRIGTNNWGLSAGGVLGLAMASTGATITTGTITNLTATNNTSTIFVATTSTLGTVISGLWNGTVLSNTYGGTGTTTLTQGYIPFGGTSYYEQNANLFWDNTNNRLGIGTTTPASQLVVVSSTAGTLFSVDESGYAYVNGKLYVGSGASSAVGANAQAIFMQTDLGVTSSHNIGAMAQAVAVDASVTGRGFYGIAKTNGAGNAYGLYGLVTTTAAADTGTAYGVYGIAQYPHSGASNYGVYGQGKMSDYSSYGVYGVAYATAASTYASHGVRGIGYSSTTKTAYGVSGWGYVGNTADTASAYGGYFESSQVHAGGINYGVYGVAKNSASQNMGGRFESYAATGETYLAIGVQGSGYTSTTASAAAVYGYASVQNTADAGSSYAFKGSADQTHAGGANYGLYSSATNGASNWSYYGAAGLLFNADAVGFGTTSPRSALHVAGAVGATTTVWVGDLSGNIGQICLGTASTTAAVCFYGDPVAGAIVAYVSSTY